ncbi:MAG: AMP-binding protein [Burkholderiales bacterium]|nr:AMP-binding protein [Burkholderiales bacterium]
MNEPAPAARPPIDAERLLAIVAEVARAARPGLAPAPTLDSSLERELGLDSLARVELVLRLERAFGASLPEQALAAAETPRDLLRFLAASAGVAPRAADTAVASLARAGGVRPPAHAQTLVEALEYHAERQPERLAVHLYEDEREARITYGALWARAAGYAARLADAGLSPGDRVAIMLPTCAEYLYCFYGALIAGAIPVPLYPPARLSTIEDHMTRHVGILRSAGAAMMVTIPEAKALAWLLRAQVETMRAVLVPADLEGGGRYVPHAARPGDIAFLQYTSGTTGNPKGVVLTHENLLANVRAMASAARACDEDVFVSWLPLYHDMGLIGGCFATMYLGMPVALMSPLAFLARPVRWLQAIHRHRGTISGGPNFAYELCLRRIADEDMAGVDLSSWRFAFNGAEPVLPETLEGFASRFAKWGFRRNALAPVYGLAECSVGLAFTPPGEPWRVDRIDRERFARRGEAVPAREDDPSPLRFVGCGTPIPGHYLRVVDAAGLELPERHEGLLQFRGPSATSGYYRNPEATKRLFSGEWLNTGDRAYLADGYLYITGREKDLIIRGGRNLSPYELEQAVGNLAGVRRGCVAVFGVRDPASGTERVVVLAEMRDPDASRHEALRRMINELAVELIGGPVDDIVFAPPGTVPKTSSGKIRRNAAREYYERGPQALRLQPVWLQFLRLVLAGARPQLRRGLRALAGLGFALRGYLAFALVFPVAFVAALAAPVPVCWRIGSFAARAFLRLSGIPLVVSGLDNLPRDRPTVLAVNHTSYLDPVVLLAVLGEYRGYAFVAKREFLEHRLLRPLLAGFGTLFVERFEIAKSAEHAGELVEAARRGVSLIVFPEGTLTRNAGLMEFRTGAFQAAAAAGVPVVPIALRGVRSLMRDGTWYLRRVAVSVHVGDPIAPDGADWAAAVRLRDAVRAEILRHCGEPDLAPAAALSRA